MAVDGGCDGPVYFLGQHWVFSHASKLMLLVTVLAHGLRLSTPDDMVGLDVSREQREALLDVHIAVIFLHVDASNFHLVPGPGLVDIVPEDYHFLISGYPAGKHIGWRLLDGHPLEVPVHSLQLLDLVGASGLATAADA